jgi:hypothetical protein
MSKTNLRMKSKSIILGGLLCLGMGAVTSCSDALDTTSELVEYKPTFASPADSVYAVLGIVNKIQQVADRKVLIGEMLGDMFVPSERTSQDLTALANFEADNNNEYNQPADYYAIINNCNYYLSAVDSTVLDQQKLPLFRKEIVAVKSFRAWAYMQLMDIYGTPDNGIPFYTDPILKETDAEVSKYPKYTKDELCTFLINDLTGYEDSELPNYNYSVSGFSFYRFFLPVRVLLADLYLSRGRDVSDYTNAALLYRKYILNSYTSGTGFVYRATYANEANDHCAWSSRDWRSTTSNIYTGAYSAYAYIPMDSITVASGVSSDLTNVFNSTLDNLYYPKVVVSTACRNLFAQQNYCYAYRRTTSDVTTNIEYAPKTFADEGNRYKAGDLRFYMMYTNRTNPMYSTGSKYSQTSTSISWITYQLSMGTNRVIAYGNFKYLWLKMAEAINRMGCPQTAFAVLKYGLYDELFTDSTKISRAERSKLVSMSDSLLTQWETNFKPEEDYSASRGTSDYPRSVSGILGMHSLGCGNADLDSTYVIGSNYSDAAEDWVYSPCLTLQDSIIDVENKILTEMGLACPVEGHRFFDLKRVALRRNDPSIVADKVARRNGTLDVNLYNLLQDKNNWRLKLPE